MSGHGEKQWPEGTLTGEYEGQHAIGLDERWRLHVTFEGGPPLSGSTTKQVLARIEEVTQHYGDYSYLHNLG